jgi:hypothetical protein
MLVPVEAVAPGTNPEDVLVTAGFDPGTIVTVGTAMLWVRYC